MTYNVSSGTLNPTVPYHSKSGCEAKLLKPLWKSGMDITLLRIHSSLMNCFKKNILLLFYNELKFHILSRDGKMLGLSPNIRNSILSKSGVTPL